MIQPRLPSFTGRSRVATMGCRMPTSRFEAEVMGDEPELSCEFYDAYLRYTEKSRRDQLDLAATMLGSRVTNVAKVIRHEVTPLTQTELTQSLWRMRQTQRIAFARMLEAEEA